MQKPKVKVLIALFAYSGNGGIPGTIPEIALWMAGVVHKLKTDPRVEAVGAQQFCDTPITMTRNKAIQVAQEAGFDMILMLDSDNEPDGYVGVHPNAKPFMEVAFDFAYERLVQGKPTVIAAPYCGPPPHPVAGGAEVPYLFEWLANSSDDEEPSFSLHLLNRNEAARMTGICPVAALPTGVCLFTLNAFDGLNHPYFAYEFNERHSEKMSTEDVYTTRNISLLWHDKIHEDVVFAACDSWAFHHKVKKVGKPMLFDAKCVHSSIKDRIIESFTVDKLSDIDFTKNTKQSEMHTEHAGEFVRRIGSRRVKGFMHETTLDSLMKLHDIAGNLAKNLGRPLKILEIGTWCGESAIAMFEGTKAVGKPSKVFSVDPFTGCKNDWTSQLMEEYPGKVVNILAENLGDDLNENIFVIRQSSLDLFQSYDRHQGIDLLFIDGDHDYEAVRNDLAMWTKHLNHKAVVCGHDYCPTFPGVVQAVDEFVMARDIDLNVEDGIWSFNWELHKPKPEPVQEEANVG